MKPVKYEVMTALLDQIRKTPINLEEVCTLLGERIEKAKQFIIKVKSTTKDKLASEFEALSTEYTSLETVVSEFEKLKV